MCEYESDQGRRYLLLATSSKDKSIKLAELNLESMELQYSTIQHLKNIHESIIYYYINFLFFNSLILFVYVFIYKDNNNFLHFI